MQIMPRLITIILLSLLLPTLPAAADEQNTAAPASASCGDGGSDAGALFIYDGKRYGLEELGPTERQSLYELEVEHYRERKQILDDALWQLHLAAEAERQQKERNQLAIELLQLQQPSEEQLQSFYEANKAQIPAPYEQVKPQLIRFILQQQAARSRAELISELQSQARYQVLAARPEPPIAIIDTEGYPSAGSGMAPVEIVEFSDYQCPHCKTASEAMARLQRKFGEQLRVVYMDFPINRSGISTRVAEGAVCADQQDAYLKYHEAAFARQSSLTPQSPTELASNLGLDGTKFAACLEAESTRAKVAKSKAEALRLGLSSTPAFFVNGRRVTIGQDFDKELTEAVERALEETGS